MNTTVTSFSSIAAFYFSCASSTKGTYIYTAWFVVYLLLLPLFLVVLHVGLRKWQKQRSSANFSISHSDAFACHMAAQEVLMTVGAALFMFGLYRRHYGASASGTALITFTTSGQVFLHALTCIERYLAVLHPITYLCLKRRGGVTVRNVGISAMWLLSTVYMVVHVTVSDFMFPMVLLFLGVGAVLAIVIFCSISVLCVLIRTGPGEKGGNRKRIDQSKLSAFITIMAILGVLLVRLVQLMMLVFRSFFTHLEPCVFSMSTFWFSLPSSLVLLLLFLHREGKLSTCR